MIRFYIFLCTLGLLACTQSDEPSGKRSICVATEAGTSICSGSDASWNFVTLPAGWDAGRGGR